LFGILNIKLDGKIFQEIQIFSSAGFGDVGVLA
jgi:hypothetical protein